MSSFKQEVIEAIELYRRSTAHIRAWKKGITNNE